MMRQVGGEAADAIRMGRQRQDEGAIGKEQRARIGAIGGEGQREASGKFPAAVGQFAGPAHGRGDDDDLLTPQAGRLVHCANGGDVGFAPLAVAVEEHVAVLGGQEGLLVRMRVEVQALPGEADRVVGVVKGNHGFSRVWHPPDR